MASGEHSCTRRDLLGAAVGVAVLRHAVSTGSAAAQDERRGVDFDRPSPSRPAAPGGAPLPRRGEGDWARALAAVRAAEVAVGVAERDQDKARSRAEAVALEEVYGDRLSDFYAAVRRLMRTPAPDMAALAGKIALAVDHEVATLEGGEACMAALKADALRIAASR